MTGAHRVWEWVVEPAQAGDRVDRFLASTGALGTRSQIGKLIAEGRVRVDGELAKTGTRLKVGQRVIAETSPPPSLEVSGESIPLPILYEDDFLLVIDKPAGMVVHPAPGHRSGTLVNALLHRWGGQRSGLDPARCGIVHRLDKDTSGVILVAKDPVTHEALSKLFRGREVRKRYVAIVCGHPSSDRGEIEAPIGRHPTERKKMAVRAGGRRALTRYQVVERYRGAALLRLYPVTGRTHQIRVHLASIGCPVAGDTVYARGRKLTVDLTRQALHAQVLRFVHPRTGEDVRFEAPLPDDMARAIEELRGG